MRPQRPKKGEYSQVIEVSIDTEDPKESEERGVQNIYIYIYKPYCKPNNIPQYVNKDSNHPPSVIKNILVNVNRRLSSISWDENMFNQSLKIY